MSDHQTPISDPGPELLALRQEIDAADQALLVALGKRFNAVQKLGILKQQHQIPVYQQGRWQKVVEDRVQQAQQQGISESFTRALLDLIHTEAIQLQQRNEP